MVVGAVTLAVTLSTRGSYDADRTRTGVNQNLRAALDRIGVEIRQAGERLPSDVPAIEITDGAGGAPDTLILRRNLVDEVLPLCGSLDAGATDATVPIADPGASPRAGCAPVDDVDGDGFPDNVGAWRAFRDARGGGAWAWLYNPVLGTGEWLLYDADGADPSEIGRGDGQAWALDHADDQACRLYLLEQRTYSLSPDSLLEFTIDADTADPIHLSGHVLDFQARAVLDDGTVLDALDGSTPWTSLRAIEIVVVGRDQTAGRNIERSLAARFLPRNVLSR
jgi:type IV pilus assembly protein PilW